jgi:hypothetical protein
MKYETFDNTNMKSEYDTDTFKKIINIFYCFMSHFFLQNENNVCVCVCVCYIHISWKFRQNVSNMELANTLNSLAALYWNQSEYYRAEVAITFSLPIIYTYIYIHVYWRQDAYSEGDYSQAFVSCINALLHFPLNLTNSIWDCSHCIYLLMFIWTYES